MHILTIWQKKILKKQRMRLFFISNTQCQTVMHPVLLIDLKIIHCEHCFYSCIGCKWLLLLPILFYFCSHFRDQEIKIELLYNTLLLCNNWVNIKGGIRILHITAKEENFDGIGPGIWEYTNGLFIPWVRPSPKWSSCMSRHIWSFLRSLNWRFSECKT